MNCSDICAYGKYLPQCELIFGFWTNKIAHLSCMSHSQKTLRKSKKYMAVSTLIARTFRCLWCRGRTNQNITFFNNFFNFYLTQVMMEWLWSVSVRLVRLFLITTGLVHVSFITIFVVVAQWKRTWFIPTKFEALFREDCTMIMENLVVCWLL